MLLRILPMSCLLVVTLAPWSSSQDTFTDPKNADADFEFQGEYSGNIATIKMGIQVIALGNGKFD